VEGEEEQKPKEKFSVPIKILFSPQFSQNQKIIYKILNTCEYDENNKIQNDYRKLINKEITGNEKEKTAALMFGSFVVKEVDQYGKEALIMELPFNEYQALSENLELIKKLTKSTNISIIEYTEGMQVKGIKNAPVPGKPVIYLEEEKK